MRCVQRKTKLRETLCTVLVPDTSAPRVGVVVIERSSACESDGVKPPTHAGSSFCCLPQLCSSSLSRPEIPGRTAFFLAPTGTGTLAALLLLLRFDPRTGRETGSKPSRRTSWHSACRSPFLCWQVFPLLRAWLTLLPGIAVAVVWRAYEWRWIRRLMICLALLIAVITLGDLVPTTTAANTLPWLRWLFDVAQLLWW